MGSSERPRPEPRCFGTSATLWSLIKLDAKVISSVEMCVARGNVLSATSRTANTNRWQGGLSISLS